MYEFWYINRYLLRFADVERRFGTSSYELNRPLLKGKNKKTIGIIKDKIGGKIMKEYIPLRTKTYSYFIDDSSENKKAKGTKNLKIINICLEATQLENKINHLEKMKLT